MSIPTIKPPLGLRPRWLAEEQRMQEIAEAIFRYSNHNLPVPAHWSEELARLTINAPVRDAWKHHDHQG